MAVLPPDIWLDIASHLPIQDSFRLIQVSKLLHSLSEQKTFWLDILQRYRSKHPVPFAVTLNLKTCDTPCLVRYARDICCKEAKWSSTQTQTIKIPKPLGFVYPDGMHDVQIDELFFIPGTPFLYASTNWGLVGAVVSEQGVKAISWNPNLKVEKFYTCELVSDGCNIYVSYKDDDRKCYGMILHVVFDANFENLCISPKTTMHSLPGIPSAVAIHSKVVVWIFGTLESMLAKDGENVFIIVSDCETRESFPVMLDLEPMDELEGIFRDDILYLVGGLPILDEDFHDMWSDMAIVFAKVPAGLVFPEHNPGRTAQLIINPVEGFNKVLASDLGMTIPELYLHYDEYEGYNQYDDGPFITLNVKLDNTGLANVTISMKDNDGDCFEGFCSFWQLSDTANPSFQHVGQCDLGMDARILRFVPVSTPRLSISPLPLDDRHKSTSPRLYPFQIDRFCGGHSLSQRKVYLPIRSSLRKDVRKEGVLTFIDEAMGTLWLFTTSDFNMNQRLYRIPIG